MRAHAGLKAFAVNSPAVAMVDCTNSLLEPTNKASAIPWVQRSLVSDPGFEIREMKRSGNHRGAVKLSACHPIEEGEYVPL